MAAIVGLTVPDYRGYFLRHTGGLSVTLGARQEDAGRNITGRFGNAQFAFAHYTSGGSTSVYAAAKPTDKRTCSSYSGIIDTAHLMQIGIDASRQWGTTHVANEFRPMNISVKYIIYSQK